VGSLTRSPRRYGQVFFSLVVDLMQKLGMHFIYLFPRRENGVV
jgi:hypothetical protein